MKLIPIPMTKIQADNKPAIIKTYTGLDIQFKPFNFNAENVNIVDIAHALSNKCRFSGHVPQFYSVAQHSVLVSEQITDRDLALYGLLHDASEAYLPDVPTPLKYLPEMEWFRDLEKVFQSTIMKKFGLPVEEPSIVKLHDKRALYTEKRDLMREADRSTEVAEWVAYENVKIIPMTPMEAKVLFLETYLKLTHR